VRRSILWMLVLPLAALAVAAAGPSNLAKALDAQRQLTVDKPQDPAGFNDLGNLLMLANHRPEAEAAYRQAIALDPVRVSALFNLGLLEQEKGNLREALHNYLTLLEQEPRHAWAQYQAGAVYEALGQDSRAIKSYARAFALDPQLGFSQVNPHLIESKLVTKAMLLAYREGGARPQAPSVYEDPIRIANLLIPPPIAAAPKEGVAETAPGAAVPAVPAQAGAAKAPTVLRPSDLSKPGSSPGAGVPTGGVPDHRANPSRPGTVRTWTRPDPIYQTPNEYEEVPDEGALGVPEVPEVYTPPPGVVYQPGLPSTGRLDIRVVPRRPLDSPARLAAAGTARPRSPRG
jgi:hypothetical protein